MRVEDGQAPRRQHEDPDAGEHDPHQRDGEVELLGSSRNPGVRTMVSGRARTMPTRTRTRRGGSEQAGDGTGGLAGLLVVVGPSTSREYTGMNDADSTPSPSRFCIRLGMRSAARNASADTPRPRNAGGDDLADEARQARQQDAGADVRRAAVGVRRRVRRRAAPPTWSVTNRRSAAPVVGSGLLERLAKRLHLVDQTVDVGADAAERVGVVDLHRQLDGPGDRLVEPGVEQLELGLGLGDRAASSRSAVAIWASSASAVRSSFEPAAQACAGVVLDGRPAPGGPRRRRRAARAAVSCAPRRAMRPTSRMPSSMRSPMDSSRSRIGPASVGRHRLVEADLGLEGLDDEAPPRLGQGERVDPLDGRVLGHGGEHPRRPAPRRRRRGRPRSGSPVAMARLAPAPASRMLAGRRSSPGRRAASGTGPGRTAGEHRRRGYAGVRPGSTSRLAVVAERRPVRSSRRPR